MLLLTPLWTAPLHSVQCLTLPRIGADDRLSMVTSPTFLVTVSGEVAEHFEGGRIIVGIIIVCNSNCMSIIDFVLLIVCHVLSYFYC